MTRRERIRDLARRLRAGEDPGEIAGELEAMAGPGPGRPPDPAELRLIRRWRRAAIAESAYRGTLAPGSVPEALQAQLRAAVGSRTEADALAGELVYASPSAVEKARRESLTPKGRVRLGRRRPLTDRRTWEEARVILKAATRTPDESE